MQQHQVVGVQLDLQTRLREPRTQASLLALPLCAKSFILRPLVMSTSFVGSGARLLSAQMLCLDKLDQSQGPVEASLPSRPFMRARELGVRGR